VETNTKIGIGLGGVMGAGVGMTYASIIANPNFLGWKAETPAETDAQYRRVILWTLGGAAVGGAAGAVFGGRNLAILYGALALLSLGSRLVEGKPLLGGSAQPVK
jgi:hypothetical protein